MKGMKDMGITTLAKWGNSIGCRIPSDIIKQLNVSLGEPMHIYLNEEYQIIIDASSQKMRDETFYQNHLAKLREECKKYSERKLT